MKNRSRIEIIIQIPEIVASSKNDDSGGSGITRTRILYKAFLSYLQIKEYLSMLLREAEEREKKQDHRQLRRWKRTTIQKATKRILMQRDKERERERENQTDKNQKTSFYHKTKSLP
jgi:predicted transcriptional regulator